MLLSCASNASTSNFYAEYANLRYPHSREEEEGGGVVIVELESDTNSNQHRVKRSGSLTELEKKYLASC